MKSSWKVTADNYWNNIINNPDIDGVSPMGGCGLVEVYYRTYHERNNFLNLIKDKDRPTLLEVGCGSGRWAIQLRDCLRKYVGIDISGISVIKAIETCKNKKIKNCAFYKKSSTDFHSKKKFDVIYFGGVSQYMEDRELISSINHLKKYLLPSGLIIDRSTITLENKKKFSNKKDYFAIYRTEDEISDLISKLGFEKIRSQDSYHFLRLGYFTSIFNSPRLLNIFNTYPHIAYSIMKVVTVIQNKISPKIFYEEGLGNYTHRFQVFIKIK